MSRTKLHEYVAGWFRNRTAELKGAGMLYESPTHPLARVQEYLGWDVKDLVVGIAAKVPPCIWADIPDWPTYAMDHVVDWLEGQEFKG